jgi:predicted PurR-regulated permease PerM
MEAPMNPTVEKDKSAPGILIAASVVIILAGAMAAQEIVLILLLSVFISIISASRFCGWRKESPHFLAIILVMSLMIFLFTFLGALIGRSLTNLTASIPAYEDNLRKLSSNAFQQLDNWGFSVTEYDLIHRIDSGKVFQFFANALSELGSFMSIHS